MLPTKKREPISDLSREIILAYGIPKIGKSTFFSYFPNSLFLSTEEGLNHLSVFEYPIGKWMDFVNAVRDIEKNPTQFQTVIIDTIDNLFSFCQTYIYDLHSIKHESDLEYGKGWKEVDAEFVRNITRLSQIKTIGKVFVSHSEEKEVRKKGTRETEVKVTHTLPARARKIITPMADMILYMEMDDNSQRVIRTQPTPIFEAGSRRVIAPTIPLDYEAFVRAYYAEGGGEKEIEIARTELITQIGKGLDLLKDKKIDNFDTPKRVANSMEKHLGTTNMNDPKVTMGALQAYLQSLRVKFRENKPEETGGKE